MERLSPQESVEKVLAEYLELGKNFENPPKVTLEIISQTPPEKANVNIRDIATTTAVQCYAAGTAQMKPRPEENFQRIADSTLEAGHLTTRQHTNFTFQLVGVSRSSTHDILHSYPFYNSEQQSQRYVEAKAGNYLIPANLSENQRNFFINCANFANQKYFDLLKSLHSEVEKKVQKMYPEPSFKVEKTRKRLEGKTDKLCQEIARYVLPIGQLTTIYHTLSELDLIRLFQASQLPNFSAEARYLIGEMVSKVAKVDPSILAELRPPQKIEDEEFDEFHGRFLSRVFDLKLKGKNSRLVSLDKNASQVLADSVRNITASDLSNDQLLDLLLNPAKNPLLSSVYEVGMMDPKTQSLREISLTFATKLSHTADSQRQRQRRTPAATPPVEAIYFGKPDYITPLVIRQNDKLKAKYDETMEIIYSSVKIAIEEGIPKKDALLLLPNAQAIRLYETGDFFDWLHRFKQRLCFVAQEEIFFISTDQVEQILEVLPQAKGTLLAPCGIRKATQISPKCPEGERFCGQPVFNFADIKDYKKARLI